MQLAYILGKNPTFPGRNPTFSGENGLFSTKLSDDLFLVINSHLILIFTLPLIDQKLRKQQLIPYFFSKTSCFSAKTTRKYVFSGEI